MMHLCVVLSTRMQQVSCDSHAPFITYLALLVLVINVDKCTKSMCFQAKVAVIRIAVTFLSKCFGSLMNILLLPYELILWTIWNY